MFIENLIKMKSKETDCTSYAEKYLGGWARNLTVLSKCFVEIEKISVIESCEQSGEGA